MAPVAPSTALLGNSQRGYRQSGRDQRGATKPPDVVVPKSPTSILVFLVSYQYLAFFLIKLHWYWEVVYKVVCELF